MLGEKVRTTRDAENIEYFARHDPPMIIDHVQGQDGTQLQAEPDPKTVHEDGQELATQDDPVIDRPPERDKEGVGNASIADEIRKEMVSQADPELHRVPERDKDSHVANCLSGYDGGVGIAESFFLDADKAAAHFGEVVRVLKEKRDANENVYVTSAGVVGNRKMLDMMVDSGANVTLLRKLKGEPSVLQGRKPSRFMVQGTAGPTYTSGTGTVVAHVLDEDGEEYDLSLIHI